MDLDSIVEKLEALSLEIFIKAYQHELCKNTVNHNKVAAFLKFDFDQGAIIDHPPDNYSKSQKLYELIQKTSKVKDFIEAMKQTGNEHIIEFIEAVHLSLDGESLSFSANPKTGIWFNIPEPINSFCGREDFLRQLHEKLQNQHPLESAAEAVTGPSRPKRPKMTYVTVLSQVKVVSGLGGIGKTETAIQYIWSHRQSYNNIIWINAESENSMRNSFIKLASDELKIPVKTEKDKPRDIEEIMQEIYAKIGKSKFKANLIVFDNAEDYGSCKNFFPTLLHPDLKKQIVILATSRNQQWILPTGEIQVLPLGVMTDDESLEFILKQLEIEDSPEFREESKEFIQLIGGLPLALQQAVAYIKNEKELQKIHGKSYQIEDYVLEFKSSMKKFLSFCPHPESSSATVYVTWNVTFQRIQSLLNGAEAIEILKILSFLYADKIPLPFLRDVVPKFPIEDRKFSEALKLIEKYSLIKMNLKNIVFFVSIHRQLQCVILQYLKEGNGVSTVVMPLVEKCQVVLKNIKISESSDIFLNISQIVNNPFGLIPKSEELFDFMGQFGEVFSRASRHTESLNMYQKIHSDFGDFLGQNHAKILAIQHNIAHLLNEVGRREESIRMYKEILHKKECHPDLDVNHLSTMNTKHNIADLLRQQKKYDEALELLQQVLAQRIKILGVNHRKTLNTYNAIAAVYLDLENFPEALTLLENLEQKHTESLGADHPDVLTIKHNKAGVLLKMDNYFMENFEQGSTILNEVYEKRKVILGEDHLDTIKTRTWIAEAVESEGKLEEAFDLYKKSYEIIKKQLGEDHPFTVDIQNKIVRVEIKIRAANVSLCFLYYQVTKNQ